MSETPRRPLTLDASPEGVDLTDGTTDPTTYIPASTARDVALRLLAYANAIERESVEFEGTEQWVVPAEQGGETDE